MLSNVTTIIQYNERSDEDNVKRRIWHAQTSIYYPGVFARHKWFIWKFSSGPYPCCKQTNSVVAKRNVAEVGHFSKLWTTISYFWSADLKATHRINDRKKLTEQFLDMIQSLSYRINILWLGTLLRPTFSNSYCNTDGTLTSNILKPL